VLDPDVLKTCITQIPDHLIRGRQRRFVAYRSDSRLKCKCQLPGTTEPLAKHLKCTDRIIPKHNDIDSEDMVERSIECLVCRLIEFFRRPDNLADSSITDCLAISVGCHVVHRFRIIQSNDPPTCEASGNLGEGDAWAGAYF